eukprot:CAMPEP_0197574958 /NCGR_PEP_ID=MMETSP1326-20131121/524_1 /TAXON_ID=1155430 /ORGANISM="Genus nov. species nov., Strain RCC2288" /LENGTH=54 /DNA_ID=CAMNT_0043137629 /DNA_START=81 /DNA_END=245 /DNA_ORIENTATION=-
MAISASSVTEAIYEAYENEFKGPNREGNMTLLRAGSLFLGAIFFMRNFGEHMSI